MIRQSAGIALRRVVSRVQARRAAGDERGSALIEVLIFMLVIMLTMMAYVTSAGASEAVVRKNQSNDIVSQQAQSILQAAQSEPWSTLGLYSGQSGYVSTCPSTVPGSTPSSSTGCNGQTVVKIGATAPSTATFAPKTTTTTRGVAMTEYVYVTWASGSPSDPASYGTKNVTVAVVWSVPGTTKINTSVYSMERTSSVSEATAINSLPADITSQDGDANPNCVSVTRTANTVLSWNTVPNGTASLTATLNYEPGSADNGNPYVTTTSLPSTSTSYTTPNGYDQASDNTNLYGWELTWKNSSGTVLATSCKDVP